MKGMSAEAIGLSGTSCLCGICSDSAREAEFWEYPRRGSLHPLYADHGPAWTRLARDYYGTGADNAVAFFSADRVLFRVCRNETRSAGRILGPRLLGDSAGRADFEALWTDVAKRLRLWIRHVQEANLDSQSPEELVQRYLEPFRTLHLYAQAIWSAKEFLDAFLTDEYPDWQPPGASFSAAETESLRALWYGLRRLDPHERILAFGPHLGATELRNSYPDYLEQVEAHVERFYWTGATYAEIESRDTDYVLDRVFHGSAPPHPAPGSPTRVPALAFLGPLLEERREVLMQGLFAYQRIQRMLARSFDTYTTLTRWISIEEWKDCRSRETLLQVAMRRYQACFATWRNGAVELLEGHDALLAEQRFLHRHFLGRTNILEGTTVVPCSLTGHAWLMETGAPRPPGPVVLVVGMTTPDIAPLLDQVAAVVTDEGGVTCHAATICRERNLPCVVGTMHATRTLANGDVVTLDGSRVQRRSAAPGPITARPAPAPIQTVPMKVSPLPAGGHDHLDNHLSADLVGPKAAILSTLRSAGFPVPDGLLIHGRACWDSALVARLTGPMVARCYAVRSSAPDEDRSTHSGAGKYETFLMVEAEDLPERIARCAGIMLQRGADYPSVIIQPMVDAQLSGVAFSMDVRHGRRDRVLVEASPGVGGVVAGDATPQRFTCRRSGDLERADLCPPASPGLLPPGRLGTEQVAVEPLLNPSELADLVETTVQISHLLGTQVDIEWGMRGDRSLVVLQARPLTGWGTV